MIKKMQKLICTLFFQGIEKSKISEIVTSQLRLLGFTPNYLKAGEKEISYDLNALIDWIEKGERSINCCYRAATIPNWDLNFIPAPLRR